MEASLSFIGYSQLDGALHHWVEAAHYGAVFCQTAFFMLRWKAYTRASVHTEISGKSEPCKRYT